MEFVELIKEYNRMCNCYSDNKDHCEDYCPLCVENLDIEDYPGCDKLLYTNPTLVEKIITQWSREHPLPIYPTIGEIVSKICVLMGIDPHTCINTFYDERLTKEAADYFGIKPINEK